eukprot:5681964-Alexandrium_andersonii.AAC.1
MTKRALAFLVPASGSFFQVKTHLAWTIRSGARPAEAMRWTTRLSIHEAHSLVLAWRKRSFSEGVRLRSLISARFFFFVSEASAVR